jgi:hypothetical protein
MISVGTAAVVAVLCVPAIPAAGQQASGARQLPPYRPTRMADGHPDLNGLWQAFVTANWDIQDHEAEPGSHPGLMGAYGAEPAGQSVVEDNEIFKKSIFKILSKQTKKKNKKKKNKIKKKNK